MYGPKATIHTLDEFNIRYREYEQMAQMADNQIVFLCIKNLINVEKLRKCYKMEELCKRFSEWDAMFCEYELEVPGVLEKPLRFNYIVNTEGKFGFDTQTYLKKLASKELKDDGYKSLKNSELKKFSKQLFPKQYSDFEIVKLWGYTNSAPRGKPPLLYKSDLLLFEKLSLTKPNAIPCYVSYCFVEGLLDCFIVRNKNYSLARALEEVLDGRYINRWLEDNEDPPDYEESCRNYC